MGEFAIGQGVPRFEDPRLIRGGGRYADDVSLPRMAYGYVLRSPHAHARIKSIKTDKAKAASGVLTVLTWADWNAAGFNDLPVPGGMKRRDGSPSYKPAFPPLVKDRVRWVGDYVAFVVAETLHQAADAAELIEVDYEPLPAVTDTAAAAASGAPLVWDDCPDNVCFVRFEGDKAATDAAFAKADHVVKHRFVINRVTAATMEPRAAVGDYNAADDRYTLYCVLQRVQGYRADVSKILKVPESKVRIVSQDVGGSFGMKSAVFNENPLTLFASKVIGRPVKWTSTRSEAFLSDAQARDNVVDAELALDKEGNFLGFRVKTIVAAGAYLQPGMQAFTGNLGTLAGVYKTPASHVDVTVVFSNTNPMRPYRGNGRPEAAYVIERIVDLAARELGFDPYELRRKNMIAPEQMPFKTSVTFTYDCGEFEKSMDMALKMAHANSFEKRRSEAKKRGKLRGLGLSFTIERAADGGFEGAEIRFDRTGAATLVAGSHSQGQGHETVFKQIVCDRLGLDPSEVYYLAGDSDQIFFGEGTGGSRSATLGGSAFLVAADKIVTKATKVAAHMLDLEPDDISFEEGIFSSKKSNQTLTMKEVALAAADPTKIPKDMEVGLVCNATYSTDTKNFPNGCHICELEIDAETGEVEIVEYNVVDDVGTVLNPLLLHGQIDGGIAQGIGQILMEDIRFDAQGQLLTGSFMDYAMPRARTTPAYHMESNPVPTKTNPLGTKGAGEAGCVGAMPAVANALVDALAPLGVTHVEMPATPERLWRTIHEARAG